MRSKSRFSWYRPRRLACLVHFQGFGPYRYGTRVRRRCARCQHRQNEIAVNKSPGLFLNDVLLICTDKHVLGASLVMILTPRTLFLSNGISC